VGKVINPDHIIDKATKLETIMDRIELISVRLDLYKCSLENSLLKKKLELIQKQGDIREIHQAEEEYNQQIIGLQDDIDFITTCNISEEYMSDEKVKRIQRIGRQNFEYNGVINSLLSENEIENLCIRKGTLTEKEREIVESHASVTFKITEQLNFPDNLKMVPEYAAGHHEKLDGTGYPKGLAGEEIAIQSRIMAIADIFEALTAKDRPYKKPMKLSESLHILETLKNKNHIDSHICDLFINERLYEDYVKKELDPKQIDVDL